MNKPDIDFGLIRTINIEKTSSPEDFALLVLKTIHESLNEEKDNLFPCHCNCINNTLVIALSIDGFELEETTFQYSPLIGFNAFNLVREYYLKFSKFKIFDIVVNVDQNCQK